MKGIERFASAIFMWVIVWVSCSLPWKGKKAIGALLGGFAYLVSRNYREITFNNLGVAFGRRYGKREVSRIARLSYVNLGRGLCEAIGSIHFAPERLKKLVRIEGKDNLDLALKRGRGVIAFSAHLGNFVLMGGRLAAGGYPFSFLIRNPEVKQVANVFKYVITSYGMGVIPSLPRKKAVAEVLKRLRKNEIVCILGDQRELQGGVFVDFFNRRAGTVTGPAVLSMRTGASIVPMFSVNDKDGGSLVVIEEPFKLSLTEDREKDVYFNTERLNRIIESYVSEYPAQWFWLHQRWKLE